MKRNSQIVQTISEIGIFAALGFVIDELQGIIGKGLFVNGGSIGFAMIAVLIIGLRRGWLPALITGLIMGLFDFATGAYILHPVQALLDYIFPYGLTGLACILCPLFHKLDKKGAKVGMLITITFIAGFIKFLSHYLAGVIFWADSSGFAWNLNEMNPYLYSLVYNIAYIGPCIVLTAALLVFIYLKAPLIVKNQKIEVSEEEGIKSKKAEIIATIVNIVISLGIAIWALISYINSFETYDGGFEADSDSMLILIIYTMLLLISVIHIISIYKKGSKNGRILYGIGNILIYAVSLIYAVARVIRCYVKEKDPTTYWIWIASALVIIAFLVTISIVINRLDKKNQEKDVISTNL